MASLPKNAIGKKLEWCEKKAIYAALLDSLPGNKRGVCPIAGYEGYPCGLKNLQRYHFTISGFSTLPT